MPVAQCVALIIIFNAIGYTRSRGDRVENRSPCKDWLLDVFFRPLPSLYLYIITHTALSLFLLLPNSLTHVEHDPSCRTRLSILSYAKRTGGGVGGGGEEKEEGRGDLVARRDDRDVISLFAVAASIYM